MRAAAINKFGDPEVLKLQTLRVPIPDPHDVLIEVDTAGVGPWDADIRGGWSPGGHIKFPYVLGYEGSGTVVPLGSHVQRFKIGDHVYAYSWNNPQGGFYAEYTAVPAEKVAPIPKRVDLFHAGTLPISGLTALQGIDDVLELKRDEHIIIHGGSGGVGTIAIQFARLRHARVFASASGEDGVALALRLGRIRQSMEKQKTLPRPRDALLQKALNACWLLPEGQDFRSVWMQRALAVGSHIQTASSPYQENERNRDDRVRRSCWGCRI